MSRYNKTFDVIYERIWPLTGDATINIEDDIYIKCINTIRSAKVSRVPHQIGQQLVEDTR